MEGNGKYNTSGYLQVGRRWDGKEHVYGYKLLLYSTFGVEW